MVENVKYDSPLGRSDHCIIKLSFICYIEKQNTRSYMKYFLDKGDYANFRRAMDCNWDDLLGDESYGLEKMWQIFKDQLEASQDKFIPHKVVTTRSNRKWKTPLNETIVKKIRKKHRAWTRYMEIKINTRNMPSVGTKSGD